MNYPLIGNNIITVRILGGNSWHTAGNYLDKCWVWEHCFNTSSNSNSNGLANCVFCLRQTRGIFATVGLLWKWYNFSIAQGRCIENPFVSTPWKSCYIYCTPLSLKESLLRFYVTFVVLDAFKTFDPTSLSR